MVVAVVILAFRNLVEAEEIHEEIAGVLTDLDGPLSGHLPALGAQEACPIPPPLTGAKENISIWSSYKFYST